jgi:hypothetical protein
VTASLHRRAKEIRERQLVRAWHYRQRNHASGVWFRLRRVLTDAAQVWIIGAAEADLLESRGKQALAVGSEFEPRKRIYCVTADDLAALPFRRQIAVRISPEFLDVETLALVGHTEEPREEVPDG